MTQQNMFHHVTYAKRQIPPDHKLKMPLSSSKPLALVFGDWFHLHLVNMPRSSAGHIAIRTLVDAATDSVVVHLCSDKTHVCVIEALRTKVFPNFGCPKKFVTVKGKENISNEVGHFKK